MSGQQPPRRHGSPSDGDAPRTRSALPEALHSLILRETQTPLAADNEDPRASQISFTRSSTSLPPLITALRLIQDESQQPSLPVTASNTRDAAHTSVTHSHPTANLSEEDERELFRLQQRERFERTSPSQVWPAYRRDEISRPQASRSQTHPQMPSTSTSSSSRSVRHSPAYLHPLPAGQVPARSHSTDYYTDSSNASAASSGGRPPQSTASSGSSHRSVRVEEWARPRRPDSVGLDSNSRIGDQSHSSSSRSLFSQSHHYDSPRAREHTEVLEQRVVRPRISATRGTFRESPGQERRESNLGHRSRQHSTSSTSTSARDRSSSPTGLRTPSAGRPYHPISDQRSEQPRRLLLPVHATIERADEPEYRSLASRRSSWVGEDTRETQARSGDSAPYYRASEVVSPFERDTAQSISTARRRGEYEASGSGSSRYEPTQPQSESTTSLLWYPEAPDGHPSQYAESSSRYPPSGYLVRESTPARSVSSSYVAQYGAERVRQTVQRSVTTPLRGSHLVGPGQPGRNALPSYTSSLPTLTSRLDTQDRTSRAPSYVSQLSLSAPTPGYASNPAETFEERFGQDSPEASPATNSPSQTSYDRGQEHASEATTMSSTFSRGHERTSEAPPATYSPSGQEHTSTSRAPTSHEERRLFLQLETSTASTRPVPYPFPPEAHPRLTVSTPYPVPGRPSPVEHQSPSSAKRAKTNSSPASSFDLHDYVNLSSSPASGAGTSVRSTGLSARPQRASTPQVPAEERTKPATGTTGKRKKSPNSKSETGRPRAKGKRAERSADAAILSASASRASHRPTEEELAHIAAFSGDFMPDRQLSEPTSTYHSEAHLPQQEQSIHPQLLLAPTPQRTGTLDVPGEHEPPPPHEKAASSRVGQRDVKGKGKESNSEKSPSDETDSGDQSSETELLGSKGKGKRKTGTKGKGREEREGSGSTGKPSFAMGTLPTAEEARKGRVKIPVACEFCRKRKMRCDGNRPSCSNCIKKAPDPCFYVDVVRRRGPGKKTKGSSSREKSSNKRIRETEKEQKKKEEEEARRLEELGEQEKETRDSEIERGLSNLRDTLARMLSPEQDSQPGRQSVLPQSLLANPSDAPETTGGRLNLFSGLSPLSPLLPSPSAPGDLSSLRMPEPMSLDLSDDLPMSMQSPLQMPVPDLMDVRMASPPAMSTSFLSHSPPPSSSEMPFTETSMPRPEPQSFRSSTSSGSRETRQDPRNSTAQQARQGQLGDLHQASSSSGSQSSSRRSRDQLSSVASASGPVQNVSRGPSSSHASSSRTHTAGGRSASGPMPTREQPSSLLSRSASVRNAPSSSGRSSHSVSLNTIPTPAQLLRATSSRVSTTAPVVPVPSQARATVPITSSLPMLTPEQVEAIARQALGARGQSSADGGTSAGVRSTTSSRGGSSSVPAAGSGQSQIQSVASAGLSSSASVPSAHRLNVTSSGHASGFGSEPALASTSSRIRELGSVPESRASVGTASASMATLTSSAAAGQSSEDDTNKGKRKHTRTKRRREGGDPSLSSSSIPNVLVPASEASTSQTAQTVPTLGSVSESASEAHHEGVSTRQLENLRREEEGRGRPQAGLPRPGDDSRSGDNHGPSSASNRPLSSRITIGQRRGRADSFGVYYGGYEAHEGDPVSGERPSKRAKEDAEEDRRRSEHDTRGRSSSSAPTRARRGGAQMGEGEDVELEDGEIREPAADPSRSRSRRAGDPPSSSSSASRKM